MCVCVVHVWSLKHYTYNYVYLVLAIIIGKILFLLTISLTTHLTVLHQFC